MTDTQTFALVLTNQAGEYFLLPHETIDSCRVPQERKAELERILGQPDDAAGYVASLTYQIVGGINTAMKAIGIAIAGAASPPTPQERKILDFFDKQVGGIPT
jgi:hypothetical protein